MSQIATRRYQASAKGRAVQLRREIARRRAQPERKRAPVATVKRLHAEGVIEIAAVRGTSVLFVRTAKRAYLLHAEAHCLGAESVKERTRANVKRIEFALTFPLRPPTTFEVMTS